MHGSQWSLEVHLLDPSIQGTFYGEWLEVTFLRKLRDEMKFPSVEHLIAQIKLDVEQAKMSRDFSLRP
jgi:riboflavin kinase/FMN adenylyltransferase